MIPEIGRENLLEVFVTQGNLSETVDILGQKITLRVLDSGEQREVFEQTTNLEPIARLKAIQHETLARSIMAINGAPVTYVPKDKDEKVDKYKLIYQNLETLKKATQKVVDLIFDEYEKLVEKQNNQIEELKKKLQKNGQEPDGKSAKK